MTPLVLKLGGELLEAPAQRNAIAALADTAVRTRPLVLVHGGGRAIDAELTRRQIAPKKVDGLRITDADTLDVVVSVLAGSSNTALVAALVGKGVRAVGLTGVDAGLGKAARVGAHRTTDGRVVDLGLVGDPVESDGALIRTLIASGYVPVIASIGLDSTSGGDTPAILNVNADVMAFRIAAALTPCDLVISGGTPGVLDDDGTSIASLGVDDIDALVSRGTATAGMIAKLAACRTAIGAGVSSVRIVDGRLLDGTHGVDAAPGTTLAAASARAR